MGRTLGDRWHDSILGGHSVDTETSIGDRSKGQWAVIFLSLWITIAAPLCGIILGGFGKDWNNKSANIQICPLEMILPAPSLGGYCLSLYTKSDTLLSVTSVLTSQVTLAVDWIMLLGSFVRLDLGDRFFLAMVFSFPISIVLTVSCFRTAQYRKCLSQGKATYLNLCMQVCFLFRNLVGCILSYIALHRRGTE